MSFWREIPCSIFHAFAFFRSGGGPSPGIIVAYGHHGAGGGSGKLCPGEMAQRRKVPGASKYAAWRASIDSLEARKLIMYTAGSP